MSGACRPSEPRLCVKALLARSPHKGPSRISIRVDWVSYFPLPASRQNARFARLTQRALANTVKNLNGEEASPIGPSLVPRQSERRVQTAHDQQAVSFRKRARLASHAGITAAALQPLGLPPRQRHPGQQPLQRVLAEAPPPTAQTAPGRHCHQIRSEPLEQHNRCRGLRPQ